MLKIDLENQTGNLNRKFQMPFPMAFSQFYMNFSGILGVSRRIKWWVLWTLQPMQIDEVVWDKRCSQYYKILFDTGTIRFSNKYTSGNYRSKLW